MSPNTSYLHRFDQPVGKWQRPERFNFPFAYTPDPLSRAAAEQTQRYLLKQKDFIHPFGLAGTTSSTPAIGKMFGVLVVEDSHGELGFLAAVSGKLAGGNQHRYFVPPVFDMLRPGDFFLEEEAVINRMNYRLKELQESGELEKLSARMSTVKEHRQAQLSEMRSLHKVNKRQRKVIREQQKDKLDPADYQLLLEDLIKQSYRDQHEYDLLKKASASDIKEAEAPLKQWLAEIESLKQSRKSCSAMLQRKLFDQYRFLNARGDVQSLLDMFSASSQELPPAGAGECAAPKLLQHAYFYGLKPICMAEFWWGASPRSEVRKHGYFYPACRGKCEPILQHMLQGMSVDPNPMLINPAEGKDLPIVYQDQALVIVNKPAELLTVPGIHITDSVQSRIQALFPELDSPWIVHRLDMSTSGLLVLAKSKDIHEALQRQFADRTVGKRYTALLDGIVERDAGEIQLPLRVDLNDRPRQVVCEEHGRAAHTRYRIVERQGTHTRIHFFPITGRTHQLRVHAAHVRGLNTPILGDDLYGMPADRLHLHAGWLSFKHPLTGQQVEFEIPDPF